MTFPVESYAFQYKTNASNANLRIYFNKGQYVDLIVPNINMATALFILKFHEVNYDPNTGVLTSAVSFPSHITPGRHLSNNDSDEIPGGEFKIEIAGL